MNLQFIHTIFFIDRYRYLFNAVLLCNVSLCMKYIQHNKHYNFTITIYSYVFKLLKL